MSAVFIECGLGKNVVGERGFINSVFKNNGFLDNLVIGDRELSSRVFIFCIDWGKEYVRGDAVMCDVYE